MGTLFLDVIDERTGSIIGRAKIEYLSRLTPQTPIRSVFAVANAKGAKIGDLTVNMSFELIRATKSIAPSDKNMRLSQAMGDSTGQGEINSTDYCRKCTGMLLEEVSSRLPMFDIPKTTDEQHEEPNRDAPLQQMESPKKDTESNLSVEVLARIQSALEQSRQLRQQVLAGINAEQRTVEDNSSPPFNQQKPIGLEILSSKGGDFQSAPDLAIQTAADVDNAKSIPYWSESYPCLLDSVSSQMPFFNKDSISKTEDGDFSDEDLEKDAVIEKVLLPRMEAVKTIEKKNVFTKAPSPILDQRFVLEQPKREFKSSVNHVINAEPFVTTNAPVGIRLHFRRLTFPNHVWNALGVLLSAVASPSAGINPLLHEGTSLLSKANRNRIAIQNRLMDASPPNKKFLEFSKDKPWDLFLEILVPSFLANKEANTESSIWCKRINLCRRLSKNTSTTTADQNTSPTLEDSEVFIIPQKNSFNGEIVLSMIDLEDDGNIPIHLNLFCRPPSLNGTILTILIGTIELNLHSLISAMYQSPNSSILTSSTPSSKTLRIRLDFADVVKHSLMESLDVNFSDVLLKKSFGFINIEPVFDTPPKFVKNGDLLTGESLIRNYQTPTDYLPLDILLNIREGHSLHLASGSLQNSFLIVRIPWCTEEVLDGNRATRKAKRFISAVSWGTGTSPTYHFGLKASAILSEDLKSRLSKSFIAIEVWARHTDSGSEKDELIGLAKIATSRVSTLHRLISSQKEVRNSRLPFLQEDSWLEVISPSTGHVSGQLRSRFAAGTPTQISALMDADRENAAAGRYDWRSIDFIRWKDPSLIGKFEDSEFPISENLLTMTVNHVLNISLIKLTDFHPELSETLSKELGSNAFLYSDYDCFLQYRIAVDNQKQSSVFRSPSCQLMPSSKRKDGREIVYPPENAALEEGSKEQEDEDLSSSYEGRWQEENGNEGWDESHKYAFAMEMVREEDILKNIKEIGSSAFLDYLRKDRFSQDGIVFELWLHIYSPKLRDVCVAQGKITWSILEQHLLPPSSLFDVNKITNFPINWKHEISHHSIELFNISANKVLGRISINIGYEMTSTVSYSVDWNLEKVSQEPIFKLLPLTIHPGVHLNVHFLDLTGFRVTRPLQIRMHCLLLLPSKTSHSQYKVLASGFLKLFTSVADSEKKEKLNMKLDVLLPLGWNYELPFKERFGTKLSRVEEFGEFSLAEALAYGAIEINDRQSWLVGNVSRPCLVIQVNVWDLDSGFAGNHKENQICTRIRFDRINYNSDDSLELRQPGKYGLIATCRFPLSDLLYSGSISPRWISLLQVPSASKSSEFHSSKSSLEVLPYRLAGAIQISANFVANSPQRNILENIMSVGLQRICQTPRELGVNPGSSWSASRFPGRFRNFNSLNDLPEFSLNLSSIRLPTESTLLNPSGLVTYKERGLFGFFIRTILGSGVQISDTYSLPQTTDDSGFGIVQIQDTLTIKNVCVSNSERLVLEMQVWTKWLANNDEGKTHCNFVNSTSRLLGTVQIPLSHLFGNQLSSDSEEVFYWCSCSNDIPWNVMPHYICIPVYPLVQPSYSSSPNQCWIAFRAERSQAKTEDGIYENISNEGALVWYLEDYLRNTSSKILRSVSQSAETFPGYVVIERANRLSPDPVLKDIVNVETFVTFMVVDENSATGNAERIVTTPSVLDQLEPIWNYRRYAVLPCFYINSDSKGLSVHIWQRTQGDQQKCHLGTAKIPLSTLVLPNCSSNGNSPTGLEFVRGWYEIYDALGKSRGQILVSVYPLADNEENPMNSQLCPRLENLLNPSENAETEENDTKKYINNQNAVSIFNQSPFTQSSYPHNCENRPTNSPVSWELDPALQATNTSFLLTALQSKLEELDIQNALFKEKLSNSTNGGFNDTSGTPNPPAEVESSSPMEDFRHPSTLNVFASEEVEDCIIYPYTVSETPIGDHQKLNMDYPDDVIELNNNSELNFDARLQIDDEDVISLASTATLSSVSSLLLRNHFGKEGKKEVSIQQNDGHICPSAGSVPSTDVEQYIRRFRHTFREKTKKGEGHSNQESRQSSPLLSEDQVMGGPRWHTVETCGRSSNNRDKGKDDLSNFESKSEFGQMNIPGQPWTINSNQDGVRTYDLDPFNEPWNTPNSEKIWPSFLDIAEDPNCQNMDEDIV